MGRLGQMGQLCPLGLSETRGKYNIIQSPWECVLTACTGGSSEDFSPVLSSVTLPGSGSPCFMKPRWAQDRHQHLQANGDFVAILCYHKTEQASVLQTPNMTFSHTRCAGSNMWLLGSGGWVPALCLGPLHHKYAHHPTWVKSTSCQLASTSSSCNKGVDAIGSKWLPKTERDSNPSPKLFSQDLTNTPHPTIYT